MITAKDIMTTEVVTVKEDTPTEKVIDLLASHRITGLPVVDSEMNLAGIVSEKDILGIAYNSITGASAEAFKKTAGDLMTRTVVSFRSDDNLADICQCFMLNDFRRIPVVDDGKLVGIISRKDIVYHAFTKKATQEAL